MDCGVANLLISIACVVFSTQIGLGIAFLVELGVFCLNFV